MICEQTYWHKKNWGKKVIENHLFFINCSIPFYDFIFKKCTYKIKLVRLDEYCRTLKVIVKSHTEQSMRELPWISNIILYKQIKHLDMTIYFKHYFSTMWYFLLHFIIIKNVFSINNNKRKQERDWKYQEKHSLNFSN